MADPDRQSADVSLPRCATFLADWNHKDTTRPTIERLARLLDEDDARIDTDDYLRVHVTRETDPDDAGRSSPDRVAPAGAAAKRGSSSDDAAVAPTARSLAILIDPDKAQAAREALRAHRRSAGR